MTVKPFRYLRDPLFPGCFSLYWINLLIVKPYLPNTFSQCYFNGLICIPFWLPIMFWAMRKCRLRPCSAPPQAHEVLIPLVIWPFVFEVYAPQTKTFHGLAFGDHRDIICCVLGAFAAAVFWRRRYAGEDENIQQVEGNPNEAS